MNSRELAEIINIDMVAMGYKCSVSNGCFLAWLIREVVRCDYDYFLPKDKELLLSLAADVFHGTPANCKLITQWLLDGTIAFTSRAIADRFIIRSKNNPFGIRL